MPWVWSDELAECLSGREDVLAVSRLQGWRTAPTAYVAPSDGDLVGFALGLLDAAQPGVGESKDIEPSRPGE